VVRFARGVIDDAPPIKPDALAGVD
jgi:hypothetical protein